MPKITLRTLCLVTAILCNVDRSLEHEIPRRSFLSRRAIDGTRGKKYFDPNEDGAFDSYGSAGGQYDPYDHVTDLSDIRKNVPGEPGIDYPAYTTLPQTGFTCEGRSRGYYADEAAGCQVFHVCHDVLVSSFLCPIGSTFSQKLLTCDWWTKVDCAATGRYFEVNRGNHQVDDDEMIRNAYAMISLQSSAEDVTRDGLVDPDSGARIVDYSVLGGRTAMGYTPGFRRITDYAAVEATGNDLPSGFEDYPHRDDRQILNYDRYGQRARTNPAYQGKLRFENKERSPYCASLIIRHDYQDRPGGNEFQDDYRRPDGLTNRLQTSYAPTVPTVTTTTRRFYSPTVPTTYRPSTLAYSKLDLMVESSDHLYAHSKSPATPPTIIHQNDDVRNVDLRETEAKYDSLKRSESVSAPRTDRDDKNDGDIRFKEDETRLDLEEKSETSFRINITDAIDEDEVFRQQNEKPIIKNDSEESLEDIETKDSIGIAQALNNPSGRIIIQNQNPVEQFSKDERRGPTTPIPPQTILKHSSGSYEKADSPQTSKKLDIFNETSDDRSTGDYEDIPSSTITSFEETAFTRSFGARTTPLLRDWQQKNIDAAQESTISVTAKAAINTTERSVEETDGKITATSLSNDSGAVVDQISSSTGPISGFIDETISRINLSFEVPQPAPFLKPPFESFLINVPEETPEYTTTDENPKTFWNSATTTTEIPRFSSANNSDRSPIYDENVEEQPLIDYADEGPSETPNLGLHPTVQVTEVSTPIPWFLSTWDDQSIVQAPVTEIVPPIVDYNDGFGDFVPPDEHSYTAQLDPELNSQKAQDTTTAPKKNDSEEEILARYNAGFEFTIRDAIKAQQERTNSKLPCYSSTSDGHERLCETSSVAPAVVISTPSVEKKTISIDRAATTRIPEQLISSGGTKLPEKLVTLIPNESLISTTQSPITTISSVDTEGSNLKTATSSRDVLKIESPEERTGKKIDITESNPLESVHPESLKQIEETIDKDNSPYQVSFTVKNDDLETTADDFISRLISQHQRPLSVLNDEADNIEIIKSIESETATDVARTLQVPKFTNFNRQYVSDANVSFPNVINDTAGQLKQSESNVSMLSLIQLMAELLKLDRLPRPFSAKDLHSVELRDSFNLDPDEQTYVTTSQPLDYTPVRTSFRNANSKISVLDTLKAPINVAGPKTFLNLGFNEPSFVTANPSLDRSQGKTPFKNTNFKTSVFDRLRTPASIVESKAPQNLGHNEPSFVTINPSLDPSQIKTPFGNKNSKVPPFDNSFKISSNVNIPAKVNFNNVTEEKASRSKPETIRPLQKQEILEQLTENFGQPLYRGDSIRTSLVFELPQVQRSLDFQSGLPIEENERVTSETEKEDPVSSTTKTKTTTTATTTSETITTTESVRTIVETEFVPSLGFSFDTNEGREEYVQAILGGLIDEHASEEGKNETNVAQLTDEASRNDTLRLEQHEDSENIKRPLTKAKN